MDNLETLIKKYLSIVNTTQVRSDKTFYIYTTGLAEKNDY